MAVAPSARVSPELIVAAGCAIALVTFGPRAAAGLFQIPITTEYGWGRDVFGLAIAVQNLLWGLGQPFAGAVADRFGATRVLCAGALLYALGLVVMAYATTPGLLHLGAGVLVGFGLSGASFNLVLGAFGKLLPEDWRPIAFGAGTAAGSFGQFLFPPIANVLIDAFGWHQALVVFAASLLVVLPLSIALATRKTAPDAAAAASALPQQSIAQALSEAFRHRSYVLLVLGFFTCGFQLAFITATCRPISRTPGCPRRSAGGRWPSSDSPTPSGRSGRAGCPAACRSAGFSPGSISAAPSRSPSSSLIPASPVERHRVRRRHRASCGCRPCRRPRRWSC